MAQHTCTGCVPIDAKIIDVYIQLLGLKDSTIEAAERAEYAAEHAIGKSPYIGENGDWWEWNDEQGVFIDTGVQAQGSIAVDTAMSSTSTNPVQNKVIAQVLNEKYTKPATGIPASDLAGGVIPDVSGFYTKPANGIPADDIAAGVIPDVSQFITTSANNLVNYYLKSETYNKSEVQEMIGAIQGFSYEVVASLPTASASTKGKIYLVPSSDPQTQNVKDEFITIDNGASSNPRYTWEQIGSTAIDLSGYVTTTQLNTALAAYTTTANLTTLLAAKQDNLVSGTNIKTVNGESILGSGNLSVSDQNAVKVTAQTLTDAQKTQARSNIGAAAASALSALETSIAAKYSKPSEGIPETDLASAVQSALALARTSIQSLADYYSKTEIDALLDAVGSEQYVDVTTLPTASASTLGKIYLVGPDANGFYDRYYTSYDGSTYSWVAAGNTEINLANYATKAELSQLQQEMTAEISQLEHEVHNLSGKYYGLYEDAESLPEGDAVGYAFVGTSAPFAIYQFDGEDWTDSGATVDSIQGEPGADGVGFASVASPTPADGTVIITLSNGDTMTLDLNHNHPQYLKYVMLNSESDMPASPDSTTLYMWPETE